MSDQHKQSKSRSFISDKTRHIVGKTHNIEDEVIFPTSPYEQKGLLLYTAPGGNLTSGYF